MFCGEKLRNVRELKGLSRKELADQIDVSEQAVWQYENYYILPKFEIINKLKIIFSVKSQFFYTESFAKNVSEMESIAYRARDRESRKKVKMETTFINYANYFISTFNSKLHIQPEIIYSLRDECEEIYNKNSDADVRLLLQNLAEKARKKLKVFNNKELLYKLELSGIFIFEKNMGSDIDAYSTWTIDDRPFIVLGNKKKSAVRRNFDLAHELGHLLIHRKIDMDSLTKEEHKIVEKEANNFASYFLLPETQFIEDFSSIKKKSNPLSYKGMKMKYYVSIAALEYRAYKLGLLSFEENRYFHASINRNDYRIIEPLDEDIPIVRPGKTRALLNVIFENHILSLNEFLLQYNIESSFLESLFGIDEGFLNKYLLETGNDYYTSNVVDFSSKII